MPMRYDWSETKAKDDKEFWEEITKARGGGATCGHCDAEIDEEDFEGAFPEECPECGESGEFSVGMEWNIAGEIVNWLFNESGGNYPERGAQAIEGEYPYEMDEEKAKKCVEDLNLDNGGWSKDELVERLVGLKVSAYR